MLATAAIAAAMTFFLISDRLVDCPRARTRVGTRANSACAARWSWRSDARRPEWGRSQPGQRRPPQAERLDRGSHASTLREQDDADTGQRHTAKTAVHHRKAMIVGGRRFLRQCAPVLVAIAVDAPSLSRSLGCRRRHAGGHRQEHYR